METELNMLELHEVKETARLAAGLIDMGAKMQKRMDALVGAIKDNIVRDFESGLVAHGAVVRHPWANVFSTCLAELMQGKDKKDRDSARGKVSVPLKRACEKAELPFTLGLQLGDDEKPAGFIVNVASDAKRPDDDAIALAVALIMACDGQKAIANKALAIAASAKALTVTEEQLQEIIVSLFPVDLGPMVVDQVTHVAQWAKVNIH